MTKISNDTVYIVDTDVSDLDSLIGTDGNTTAKRTKNFLLGKLKSYFISGLSPLTGGTLRFTEITYSGESYTTHAEVLNDLDPVFVIDQYHVVVVNLNGAKSILKLQNQSVGIDLPLVLTTDFIVLPTSTGIKGDAGKGITSVSKTSTSGLIDTYTIVFTDASTTSFTLTNGASGSNSTVPGPSGNGVTSISKTSSVGLVDTYTIAFTNGTTTNFNITNGANGTGTPGADASNNLQRDASASFTLADSDNNYVIQLKNTNDIVITIPTSGLRNKFNTGFSRKGTGEVSFIGALGVTIDNPTGFRINRRFDPAYIERDDASQVYTLFGNTKI